MARERSGDSGPQHIFVGDVQGCGDELDELLRRIRREFGRDFRLHVVGDLINRGPYNLRCLDRVRALVEDGRAEYVLGNHEISLLKIAFGLRVLGERDTYGDVLESSECDDWIEWLRRRPLVERGQLPEGDRFVMVHASAHPAWDDAKLARRARELEARLGSPRRREARKLLAEKPGDSDVDRGSDLLGRLTSCRSVSGARWSSALPDESSRPWHEAWSEPGHAYGVIYGHWALQGLHLAPGLRGLDTGCVHHGRGKDTHLTAWLPGWRPASGASGAFSVPDRSIWQIPARRRYYAY